MMNGCKFTDFGWAVWDKNYRNWLGLDGFRACQYE